jgi:mono/diheme cytochrome c family protein
MRSKWILTGTVIVGVLILLAIPQSTTHAVQVNNGDATHGATIFESDCAPCHGTHGEGRIGATLNDVFVSMSIDELLYDTISKGRGGTFMPAWSQKDGGPLSEQDIADVIAYIKSWGKTYEPPLPVPPVPATVIPPVAEVTGDPNLGYTLFQQNCAVCHGEKGEGRVGATLNDPFVSIAPGAYAIDTITRGVNKTKMPAWSRKFGGPLTDKEINDVAAYVFTLQHPRPTEPGEVVQKASATPLLVVALGSVLVIFALGYAVQQREK